MIANTGLPMLFFQLPYLALLLVPVVAIEAAVLRKRLGFDHLESFGGAMRANLVSTFAGFPLAWIVLVFVQCFFEGHMRSLSSPTQFDELLNLQVAWVNPEIASWMVPAASMVLLVLCFPVSLLIEGWQLRWHWPEQSPSRVWRATLLANLASYAMLLALGAVELCFTL